MLPTPQARIVVAVEQPSESIEAGQMWQLILVVRNDGELISEPITVIDVFSPDWRVSRVYATKGLVSSTPGQVQVALGRLQPGEQVVITAEVQAPFVSPSSSPEHCISLLGGETSQQRMCASLPQVLDLPGRPDEVTQAVGQAVPFSGPVLTLVALENVIGQQQASQLGSTLAVRNTGDAAARQTDLYIELGDTWRLSNLATTMGLVGIVDRSVKIHMGTLDPDALVVITVRGWPIGSGDATFCATLSADGQARRRLCGNLATAAEAPR